MKPERTRLAHTLPFIAEQDIFNPTVGRLLFPRFPASRDLKKWHEEQSALFRNEATIRFRVNLLKNAYKEMHDA